ncbi:MAG: hypothetical protein ABSB87_11545 [Terriglobales bacterium]
MSRHRYFSLGLTSTDCMGYAPLAKIKFKTQVALQWKSVGDSPT